VRWRLGWRVLALQLSVEIEPRLQLASGLLECGAQLIRMFSPPPRVGERNLVVADQLVDVRQSCGSVERVDQLVDVVEPPFRVREHEHGTAPLVLRRIPQGEFPQRAKISPGAARLTRTHHSPEASYRQALLAKLIEEAQEVSCATADDLPGELADVLEVLRALTVTAGTSWPQLLALAEDKRSRRGGFGGRISLESVE